MKNENKKKLTADYKQREIVGGICAIKNSVNGKVLLEASYDIAGSRNRFEFSKSVGSPISLKLQNDWNKYGADNFQFEVLEEIKKVETQTMDEFRADIKFLKEIWLEKFKKEELY